MVVIRLFFVSSFLIGSICSFGQGTRYNPNTGKYTNSSGQSTDLLGSGDARPITTAVPFLNIAPDSRAGALGETGAATSPDAYSAHWNPAKYAFLQKDYAVALSYTPWLRKLVDDMNLVNLSGYMKLRKEDGVYLSLTYFNLGKIQFTDANGAAIRDFNPNEFSLGGGYSRILSDNLSVAVGLKFIYSNLTGGLTTQAGSESKPGKSFAGDVGVYWNKEFMSGTKNSKLALGAVISNFGSKISYTNNNRKDFIPTNLRLGACYSLDLDLYNKFNFSLDANKLMVPTPPIYYSNSKGTDSTAIYKGNDPNRGLMSGTLGSFTDAPGGFKEELKEFTFSYGIEYWYAELFALRVGHFRENVLKGNRKYFTVGAGFRFAEGRGGIDVSYLISGRQNNPLEGTLRFSLCAELEKSSGKETESITE